jgi:hypothetical protein
VKLAEVFEPTVAFVELWHRMSREDQRSLERRMNGVVPGVGTRFRRIAESTTKG